MSGARFVGVDAGGTTTVCLVGDAHRVLGRGEAGSSNPNVVGPGGMRAALAEAVRSARAAAGIGPGPAAGAWVGAAGSQGAHHDAWLDAARRLLGATVGLSHDGRLLLAAAGLGAGVALVAGTGSSAYGRGRDGRESSAGGWGHLLGDEGSGYDLGRSALRAATAAIDGREPATGLVEAVVRWAGVTDAAALRRRAFPAAAVSEVAQLGGAVLRLAADGDAVARRLVRDAAGDLSTLARAVARGLDLAPPIPVVVGGGLLGPDSPLTAELRRRLSDHDVRVPSGEPAFGALELARHIARAGQPIHPIAALQGEDR